MSSCSKDTVGSEDAAFPLTVILDRGYGQVWSRLARDEQDAQRTLEAWMTEGLRPEQVKAGLRNGGDFRIQPNHFARGK